MADENKSCVRCEQGMISDVNSTNNCILCGMVLLNEDKVCCENCEIKINMIKNG